MRKFGIVIDSTVYLPKEFLKEHDIIQVSLNVIDKGISYKELEIDNEFIFNKLDEGHHLTTSQPSPGDFLEAFEIQLEKYEKVFVVTLSKPLSGTYQSAYIARNMLDNPEKVVLFESIMAAFGNEMLVLELAKMIEQGALEEEITTRINTLNNHSQLMFTIQNLITLFRSGRLSKTKVAIGSVLRIKPLLHMIEGKLDLYHSARTHKKIVEMILDRIEETTAGFKHIYIRVVSKQSLEEAKELERLIKEKFKNITCTFTDYLGPVFSTHLGTKGYGLSWTME